MSNYWKKKLDELNKQNAKTPSNSSTSNNYWKKKLDELEASQKKQDDDIAPVKTTEKKERTWFTKGAFDDGYQFGDVAKTIIGTNTDLASNVFGGILEIGEKVVDAGAYAAGAVGGLFGADKFAKDTKEFIQKDLYDGEKIASNWWGLPGKIALKILGEDSYDDASVL